jgi:hypothetical protein
MKLTGRTITVEQTRNVPELVHARDDSELRIIERRDGVFVCAHPNPRNPNPIWDNARFLADRLEATYVGPGRQERLTAGQVRVGAWLQAGPPHRRCWHRVEGVTEIAGRGDGTPRPRVRIAVEGRAAVTVRPTAPVECRPLVES